MCVTMKETENKIKAESIFRATDELLSIYKYQNNKIIGFLVNFNKPNEKFPNGRGLTMTDIEDICSDTFTRALAGIETYDVNKNKYGMLSWLYTIARNAALDFIEKKIPAVPGKIIIDKDGKENEDNGLDNVVATDFSPEDNSEIALRQAKLEDAISTLNPDAQEVYRLRTGNDNISYKEMSEMLGKSENALRSIYKRANDKIMSMMKDYDQTLKSEINN